MTDPATPAPAPRWSSILVAAVAGLAAVGAWLAWLGWRAPYVVTAGETTGPWTRSEVTGLVLTWAAVVALGCWRAGAPAVVVGAVVGLATVYVGDLGLRPQDVDDGQQGLIVLGASWLVCAAAAGGTVVALLTAGARGVVDRVHRRRRP